MSDDPQDLAAKRKAAKDAGYSDQEIDAFLAQQTTPKTPVERPRPTLSSIVAPRESTGAVSVKPEPGKLYANDPVSVARALGQGASLGFGDEIEAAVRSPFSDRKYSEIRDDIRGQNAKYREQNPKSAALANLAGGLMTGGLGPSVSAARAGGALPAAILTGAGYGATAGLGAGEGDVDKQLGSAAGGALAGAAGGALLHGAASAVKGVARTARGVVASAPVAERGMVRNALAKVVGDGPITDDEAARQVVELLKKSGKTPADLRHWDASAEPEDLIAEGMGQAGVRRLGTAHRVGQNPEPIANTLYGRAADEAENFTKKIEDLTGAKGRDPKTYADEAVAAIKPDADAAYSAARQRAPVTSNDVADVVETLRNTPSGRPALSRASELAEFDNADPFPKSFTKPAVAPKATGLVDAHGQPMMSAGEAAKTVPIAIEHLQDLRNGVDRQLQVALEKGDNQLVAGLQKQRVVIDRVLKSNEGGGDPQRIADALFSGAKAKGESFTAGDKIAQNGTPQARNPEGVRSMAAEARDPEALREGAASGIINRIGNAKDARTNTVTNPVQQFGNSTNQRARDRVAFRSDDEFNQALDAAKNASNRFATKNQVLGGSQTAERVADDASGPTAVSVVQSARHGPLRAALDYAGKKAVGLDRSIRGAGLDAEARLYLGGGAGQKSRAEVMNLLDAVAESMQRQQAKRARTAGTFGGRFGAEASNSLQGR